MEEKFSVSVCVEASFQSMPTKEINQNLNYYQNVCRQKAHAVMIFLQQQKYLCEGHSTLTSSVCNIESRMLPMAVLGPTPTTTALALPATTTVP